MIIRTVRDDENGKETWQFGQGYSSYRNEKYAIAQDIKTALLEFQNDCYFALNHGIDWLTRLGYKNQKELLDEDVYNVIVNRYGVLSVENFESDVYDREYTCSCLVYTIFSETPLEFNFTNRG